MNLAYKILSAKLKSGELVAGQQIGIQIDQTLTQDSTGTMAYLQLEAMGIEHVAVEKAVAYIDHNMLQTGFENMDDHEFIRSVAKKHGITFSKPGNGVCHQLQLENFAKPGKTLVGSDSHTPTCGAMGMIAIGAGGLDVAVAMATGTYYLQCPSVVRVNLVGKKAKWASAKDVILYILQQLSVKGGVNKIIEYTGEGLKELSLTDRATICNMGAELGATTSVFPTDEITKEYLIDLLKENGVFLKGDFTLSSGKKSDYYINMKKAITDPEILSTIAKLITKSISEDNIDKVAGPALGAVPIATAVSLESNIPLLMIRKEKKGYGTSKLIEGELNEGDDVIVVEDVTTTGGSLLKAIKAIQDNGGNVKRAFVVVDRQEGAIEAFDSEGIKLEPLITVDEFF